MFKYKVDIIKELTNHGFSTTRIRKEKIISQATLQNIRQGKSITLDTINTICVILRCQPSDIVEITPSDEEKIRFF